MKIIAFCFALFAALYGAPAANAADAPCGLVRVAELPVNIENGRLLVKMDVDGHEGWFLMDTGSPVNMLSRHMVEALGLKPLPITPGVLLYDGAGQQIKHFVTPKKLTLSGMIAENKQFAVMGESSTAEIPFEGIFGADFLAAYDVELDLPHGKMRLFSQDHCKGQVVYWTQDYATLPFKIDASLHMVMQATLDGNPMRAMLDTGSTPSTISAQTARRTFNFDPEAQGIAPDDRVTMGSGASLPVYKHKFGNLDVGGVEFHNTELLVIPDKTTRIMRDHERHTEHASELYLPTQVTIGLHHLARIRAYIAYGERMLYISAADATQ
jgi:predicted aspartyl protease